MCFSFNHNYTFARISSMVDFPVYKIDLITYLVLYLGNIEKNIKIERKKERKKER